MVRYWMAIVIAARAVWQFSDIVYVRTLINNSMEPSIKSGQSNWDFARCFHSLLAFCGSILCYQWAFSSTFDISDFINISISFLIRGNVSSWDFARSLLSLPTFCGWIYAVSLMYFFDISAIIRHFANLALYAKPLRNARW